VYKEPASFKLPYIYDASVIPLHTTEKSKVREQSMLSSCITINQVGLTKHSASSKQKPEVKLSIDPIVANLPRTGISSVYLRNPPQFLSTDADYTPINSTNNDELIQKYKLRDEKRNERPDLIMRRLVYDCFEPIEYANSNGSANFANYPMICMGKGAPTMYDPSFTKYADTLPPIYSKEKEDDTTLQFESRFENGNLRRAVQISEYEYDLFLKTDIGTTSFTQWFFFKISNTRKDKVFYL
jgi:hypothetical protein